MFSITISESWRTLLKFKEEKQNSNLIIVPNILVLKIKKMLALCPQAKHNENAESATFPKMEGDHHRYQILKAKRAAFHITPYAPQKSSILYARNTTHVPAAGKPAYPSQWIKTLVHGEPHHFTEKMNRPKKV